MSTITVQQRELAAAVGPLVGRAKQMIDEFAASELALQKNYELLYRHAWGIGEILSQLKEIVGHGNWQIWLPSHFPELGQNDERRLRNDQRCRAFFKENPNARNSAHFTADSVRKLMWGYIPAKERPQLEGDGPVTRQPHYLTFTNHFSKWNRQRKLGRLEHPPSTEQFQREITPTLVDIIELAGRDYVRRLIDELE